MSNSLNRGKMRGVGLYLLLLVVLVQLIQGLCNQLARRMDKRNR